MWIFSKWLLISSTELCLEKDAIKFDGNSGASSQHDPAHSANRAFKVQGAKQWPWANKRGQFPATVYHKFANGGTIRPNKISFTTRTNAGNIKTVCVPEVYIERARVPNAHSLFWLSGTQVLLGALIING